MVGLGRLFTRIFEEMKSLRPFQPITDENALFKSGQLEADRLPPSGRPDLPGSEAEEPEDVHRSEEAGSPDHSKCLVSETDSNDKHGGEYCHSSGAGIKRRCPFKDRENVSDDLEATDIYDSRHKLSRYSQQPKRRKVGDDDCSSSAVENALNLKELLLIGAQLIVNAILHEWSGRALNDR